MKKVLKPFNCEKINFRKHQVFFEKFELFIEGKILIENVFNFFINRSAHFSKVNK